MRRKICGSFQLLVFISILNSCRKEDKSANIESENPLITETVAAEAPNQAILASERFKQIVEILSSKENNLRFEKSWGSDGDKHVYRWKQPYKYDIKTTSSIIAPFSGVLLIPYDLHFNNDLTDSSQRLILEFNYSEGNWKLDRVRREDKDGLIGNSSLQDKDSSYWMEVINKMIE